jgi:nucleoside 2-deoxyribosyltransferase
MNIYFSFSITGGREFQPILKQMAEGMLAAGCIVPTAMNAEATMDPMEGAQTPEAVFARDLAWIDECDLIVAEVSTPSHGVGYEICYGLMTGKPVYAFYRQDVTVSKMITGNPSNIFHLRAYTDENDLMDQLNCIIVNCRQE